MTIAEIFDAFGGPAEFGRSIGVTTEHASSIRRRESIPVIYWPRIIAFAKRANGPAKKITYEELVIAHTVKNKAS